MRPQGDIPLGLCQCGCGQKTKISPVTSHTYGHVKGQPVRYVPGHHAKIMDDDRYTVDSATGCWNFRGRPNNDGYCMFVKDGVTHLAHRYFYEKHRGPIPEGMEPDHLCRNRRCMNPDHLEAVTHTENMRRASATILTVDAVSEIKRLPNVKARILAERFGVKKCTIDAVRCGKNWKDVQAADFAARDSR